ncbi:MAG: inositol monophosphatase, partial [Thermomicrobiaceae bacterium]|nr:inositol monophosphatase [Thermomicrobiaceae bacterium]
GSPRSVAIALARDAGRLLLSTFGQVQEIRYKGEVNLVTAADDDSEALIVAGLRERFPDDAILTEESGLAAGSARSRRRWIVDPLDGTTNFAHGFPMFAVSIALEVDGALDLGVVYLPALDELFVAERGAGATLNGERLAVSTTDTLIRSLLASGFPYDVEQRALNAAHWANFLQEAQGLRRGGSAAIDLCYVAAGRLDGFWEAWLSPWDVAAGVLAVREARGVVTDYAGEEYRLGSRTCLASNGRIHQQMVDVLARGPRIA